MRVTSNTDLMYIYCSRMETALNKVTRNIYKCKCIFNTHRPIFVYKTS